MEGSPLLILREIRKYTELIRSSGAQVHLYLNEAAARKARTLKNVMEAQQVPADLCTWEVTTQDFDRAFNSLHPQLSESSNLIFLDQQGMKFISDSTFLRLTELPSTDFMFFIASSSIRRFADHPHFYKHLSIPKGAISTRAFSDTHRVVTEHYRSLLGDEPACHLAPFSMKKGSNIYGVIFGSSSIVGLEKFLRVCWQIDPQRGEANFDIDDDKIDPNELHLFPEMYLPKKINSFQESLSQSVLAGTLKTDGEVYVACLREGMLPCHGREVLRTLSQNRKVRVAAGKRYRVSKDGYREPRKLEVL